MNIYRSLATLLAVTALSCTPAFAEMHSVSGSIFQDVDLDGQFSSGEELAGVMVSLFMDNGDGIFDSASDTIVGSDLSDAMGHYIFSNLTGGSSYFVYQDTGDVSSLLSPGEFNRLIDGFSDQQDVHANPIVPVGSTNLTSSAVIGGQRDLHIAYISGPAESTLRANPFGLNDVLEFSQSAGVISVATITWDGTESDMSTTPAIGGLGGIDFTEDGSDAFAFTLGIDAAGAGEEITLRIVTGTDVSTATISIPVTNGTATGYQVVPFSSFTGNASFESVDALQLIVGGNKPSVDAQIGPIGLVGSTVVDFAVSVPEPSSALLGLISLLSLASLRQKRNRRSVLTISK